MKTPNALNETVFLLGWLIFAGICFIVAASIFDFIPAVILIAAIAVSFLYLNENRKRTGFSEYIYNTIGIIGFLFIPIYYFFAYPVFKKHPWMHSAFIILTILVSFICYLIISNNKYSGLNLADFVKKIRLQMGIYGQSNIKTNYNTPNVKRQSNTNFISKYQPSSSSQNDEEYYKQKKAEDLEREQRYRDKSEIRRLHDKINHLKYLRDNTSAGQSAGREIEEIEMEIKRIEWKYYYL